MKSLIHRMTSPKHVTMIQQEVHDNQKVWLCPQAQKSQYTSMCFYSTKEEKIDRLNHLKIYPVKLLKQCSKLAVTCYRMCGYMYVWSPRQIKQCKNSTKQYKTDRCFFCMFSMDELKKRHNGRYKIAHSTIYGRKYIK